MMKKVVVILIIVPLLVVLFKKFREPSFDKAKYIAQVNKEGIQKQTYEKKVEESITFFKWQKQDISKLTTLQKDIIDRLVDESLINQYAVKHKISVFESEIKARYFQVVAGYNKRNNIMGTGDSEFLSKIKEMYGTQKSDYLLTLKEDIIKEKVQTSVKMPLVEWLSAQTKSAERSSR